MCVFLGYASQYKGYICYNVSRKIVHVSRHVIFHEHIFPYKDLFHKFHSSSTSSNLSSLTVSPIVTIDNICTLSPPTSNTSSTPTAAVPSPTSSMSITPVSVPCSSLPMASGSNPQGMPTDFVSSVEQFRPEAIPVVLQIPPMNLQSMQTRSKSGISKKKSCLHTVATSSVTDSSLTEPSTYKWL